MVSPSPVFTFKKYKKKSPRICTWKDLKNEKEETSPSVKNSGGTGWARV